MAQSVVAQRELIKQAIRDGNTEKVGEVIDSGFPFNKTSIASSSHGEVAPIHYAIIYNKPEIVKLLISRGADTKISTKYYRSSQGSYTPIQLACLYESYEIVKILQYAGVELPSIDWAANTLRNLGVKDYRLIDFMINIGAVRESYEPKEPGGSPIPRYYSVTPEMEQYIQKQITAKKSSVSEVMVKKGLPVGMSKNVIPYLLPGRRGGRSRLNKKTRRSKGKRGYTKRR